MSSRTSSFLLRSGPAAGPSLPLTTVLELQTEVSTFGPHDILQFELRHISAILQALIGRIGPSLQAESLSVLLYDGAQHQLSLSAVTGLKASTPFPKESHSPGEHLSGRAFIKNEVIFSNNISSEAVADQKMVRFWESNLPSGIFRSAVFVPFSGSLELRGVFRAFNRLSGSKRVTLRGFSDEDISALKGISSLLISSLSLVWEKYRYGALNKIFSSLPSASDVGALCSAAAKAAAQVANSAAAIVYLIEPSDPDFLRLIGCWGLSRVYPGLSRFAANSSLAGRVALQQKALFIPDLTSAPGVANREVAIGEGFKSCAAVPIQGATLKGCLAVFTKDFRIFASQTEGILNNIGIFLGSLLQAKTEAVQTEKLTQLLEVVGHSLRRPLAAITSQISELIFLLGKRPGTEEELKILETLKKQKDLAARRSEELLFIERGLISVMGLNRVAISPFRLIFQVVNRLESFALQNKVRIQVNDSVQRLPEIRGDYAKLDLVFENLLENAVKYSWRNESVEIGSWWSDKEVRITISDKGLGIAESNYTKIFEAFSRSDILDTTRYIQGTGLGLQIVKTIIEAHHGRVWVTSTPFLGDPSRRAKLEGYATIFTVSLPRQ
ncbi:MAG TPA: HAMP domain-containing sensor histidine kinase [Thermoanaerobaculia bacterium]|nr:HAMP domain-containing sensor histidine kinase [Thermoanaerobaculia bacterium]